MEIDPALVAVAGALSTVAGLLYRELLRRAERCEKEVAFWRDRALLSSGLATYASEVAEAQAKKRGAS